ncbi:MAG: hypothetical protein ACLSFT_01460 [Ruminococcus callidus]
MYQNTKVEYFSLADEAFPDCWRISESQTLYLYGVFYRDRGSHVGSIKAILKERQPPAWKSASPMMIWGAWLSAEESRKELAAAGIHVLTFNPLRPALSADEQPEPPEDHCH